MRWAQISGARLIVWSLRYPDFAWSLSQGTHFFQNLTSFGTGYFTVDPASGTGFVDTAYLDLHAGRNGDRTRA